MAVERTLSIIKPDAVSKDHIGEAFAAFEKNGLKVVATRMLRLTRHQAEGFYAEHKERGFFGGLVEFMTSGPVVVSVLKGENAVVAHRNLLGDTDPAKADKETLRARFGADKGKNAFHGSDSPASAQREVSYFFSAIEILDR